MSNFKLSNCLLAHENDIKSIFVINSNDEFLTASRDYSVRLWTNFGESIVLQEKFPFHKSYLSVVHYLKNDLYPNGLILSGGYDKVIKCYTNHMTSPEFELKGHTNTITSITSLNSSRDIVSGSMDTTAIIWDYLTHQPKRILANGHKHGIWSVLALSDNENSLLTGSADKSILKWNANNGKVEAKFIGHTDCIRDLKEKDSQHFLSCSNDETVRLWSLTSQNCISIFKNSSFLYCVSIVDDMRFACSGENGSLSVWSYNNQSKALQTFKLPCESVWTVQKLKNNDLIVGGSDGMLRVYSENPARQNGQELITESHLTNVSAEENAMDELIRHLDPVGIEALSIPGITDEDLLKVNDEGNLYLYKWNLAKDLWVKIRDLKNSEDGKSNQEDFVFSIDVIDGEPPLKLKYNIKQNPYTAAQDFINAHQLSQSFLDQVAQFIITNTNQKDIPPTSSAAGLDPFTGSSSYIPGSSPLIHRIPCWNYVNYTQINAQGMTKKILEVAAKYSIDVSEQANKYLLKIDNLKETEAEDLFSWVLQVILQWPNEELFPLVDVLRILSRVESVNSVCFSNVDLVTQLFTRCLASDTQNDSGASINRSNVMTLLKMLCNSFVYNTGETLMLDMLQQIAATLLELHTNICLDNSLMSCLSSVLFNQSILCNKKVDGSKKQQQSSSAVVLEVSVTIATTILSKSSQPPQQTNSGATNENDTILKLMMTIGNLIVQSNQFQLANWLTMATCQRINLLVHTIDNKKYQYSPDVNAVTQDISQLLTTIDLR